MTVERVSLCLMSNNSLPSSIMERELRSPSPGLVRKEGQYCATVYFPMNDCVLILHVDNCLALEQENK